MKVIVTGTRKKGTYQDLLDAIKESGFEIDLLVFGNAKTGADHFALCYATAHGIPYAKFGAGWKWAEEKYGNRKAAGPLRNEEMVLFVYTTVDYPDKRGLIALWDGESRGTKNCIDLASDQGFLIYIKEV